jgi:hypothetical protein
MLEQLDELQQLLQTMASYIKNADRSATV